MTLSLGWAKNQIIIEIRIMHMYNNVQCVILKCKEYIFWFLLKIHFIIIRSVENFDSSRSFYSTTVRFYYLYSNKYHIFSNNGYWYLISYIYNCVPHRKFILVDEPSMNINCYSPTRVRRVANEYWSYYQLYIGTIDEKN